MADPNDYESIRACVLAQRDAAVAAIEALQQLQRTEQEHIARTETLILSAKDTIRIEESMIAAMAAVRAWSAQGSESTSEWTECTMLAITDAQRSLISGIYEQLRALRVPPEAGSATSPAELESAQRALGEAVTKIDAWSATATGRIEQLRHYIREFEQIGDRERAELAKISEALRVRQRALNAFVTLGKIAMDPANFRTVVDLIVSNRIPEGLKSDIYVILHRLGRRDDCVFDPTDESIAIATLIAILLRAPVSAPETRLASAFAGLDVEHVCECITALIEIAKEVRDAAK